MESDTILLPCLTLCCVLRIQTQRKISNSEKKCLTILAGKCLIQPAFRIEKRTQQKGRQGYMRGSESPNYGKPAVYVSLFMVQRIVKIFFRNPIISPEFYRQYPTVDTPVAVEMRSTPTDLVVNPLHSTRTWRVSASTMHSKIFTVPSF